NSSPFLSHTVTFLHVVPSSHQFPCWSFLRCDCASENPNTGVPCPVNRSSGLATFPITVISDILLLHKRNPNRDWLGLIVVRLVLGVGHEAGTHLSSDTASFFLVAEVAAQVLHSVHPYERLPPVVRLVPVDSANS